MQAFLKIRLILRYNDRFKKKSISSIYGYCFLMSDKYVFFILDIDFLLLAFNKRNSSSLQNFRHVAVRGTTYLIDLLFSNFLSHVFITLWKFLVSWIRAPKDFVQTGDFQMLIHGWYCCILSLAVHFFDHASIAFRTCKLRVFLLNSKHNISRKPEDICGTCFIVYLEWRGNNELTR